MGSILRPARRFSISRIAIIGAGPSGLATAKYLLAENAFAKIDIFEQQSEVGGVWNYTPHAAQEVPIPQTTPHVPPEKPVWPEDRKAPIFSNPMYDHLNTNIPKNLMCFSDQAFLDESLLFPSREDVQEYLVKYSKEVRHLISFSTQIQDIRLTNEDGKSLWSVISKSTITEHRAEDKYDAVVVSSGHYSVPFVPEVAGIESFNETYPGLISHSKIYRSPGGFKDKKVIVVGNSASGLDSGNQISRICTKPLLNSVRTFSPGIGKEHKEEVPPIIEYMIEDRTVKFENGRIEKNVDAVVYCTGYLYSYPFLESIEPPVVSNGRRARGLYQHLFNINHPTIAFTALPQKVIPFPISEVQGAVVAKVWSNKLQLPSISIMEEWERKRAEEAGDGTSFHVLNFPQDAKYINELHDWVKGAEGGVTKEPAHWGTEQYWIREHHKEIQKRWVEDGRKARSMEELGYGTEH